MRAQSIDERVVVLFPGALGDLLLALPALRTLRARHAAAELTVVVSEPLRGLARLTGVADAVASLDAADAARLGGGDGVPSWLTGRPRVYSWLGAADGDVRRRIAAAASTAHFFRVERGAGVIHAAAAYARAVGGPHGRRALASAGRIIAPPSPAAEALWAGLAAPVLALHAGAGARGKRWEPAGFAGVGRWWREGGGTVLALAGPAEAGDALPGTIVVRDWPLPDLAAVLGRAALYLGNDGGVSHLAGAVGAAGVVLFGPTQPARWRPAAGSLSALRARSSGPDGIPLAALPAARVIAACRRHFTLTRADLDTSVGP